jgi:multidrug efflux pump subunit AcrA (membrane-fusion protein)
MPARRRGVLSLKALGAAAAILAVGFYLWQRSALVSAEPEWETVRVRRETLRREVTALGVIRPKVGAAIDVGSRVSGIVRSIPVEVGDHVARGRTSVMHYKSV